MTRRQRMGCILLAVQLVLVLSIAAKFLYERVTRPRAWVRAGLYDPSTPLRGRYLGFTLEVNACSLPQRVSYKAAIPSWRSQEMGMGWNWEAEQLSIEDGKLIARHEAGALHHSGTFSIQLAKDAPCQSASLRPAVDFFIPEHEKDIFPLPKEKALWVEVTLPAKGAPRPIRYELRDGEPFVPKWVNFTPYISR